MVATSRGVSGRAFSLSVLAGIVALVTFGTRSLSVFCAAAATLLLSMLLLRWHDYLLQEPRPQAKGDVDVAALFVWSFALRIVLGYVIARLLIGWFGEPFADQADDSWFELMAEAIANSEPGAYTDLRHPGYPFLLAFLRRICSPLGGYHYLVPRVLNAGAGAALVALTVRIAQALHAPRARQVLLALTCALFPDYLYYSSLTLRDIIIAYLWMLALCALISQRSLAVRLLTLGAVVGAVSTFRFYYAVLLAGMAAVAVTLGGRRRLSGRAWMGAVLVATVLLGIHALYRPDVSLADAANPLEEAEARVSGGESHSFGEERAGASDAFSGLQSLSNRLPRGLRPAVMSGLHFFSPLPFWRALDSVEDPFRWWSAVSGAVWFVCSLTVVVVGQRTLRARQVPRELLWIMTAIVVPVIASGISYFNVRYRLPGVGAAFLFASVGFNSRADRQRLGWLMGGFLAALVCWEVWRLQ